MRLVLIFLALAFAWCDASHRYIACSNYQESEKLLTLSCDSYDYRLQRICSNQELDVSPSDVRRLNIQKCDSSTIRDSSEKYNNVEYLDVSNSALDSLGDLNEPLKDLTELNATHNSLLNVPKAFVEKCPSLKTLDLKFNLLTKINHGDFEQPQQLRNIDISYCMLESIYPDAFGNLSDLEVLSLENNRLTEIPSLIFLNHPVSVDLRKNPINVFNCSSIAAMSPAVVHLSWEYITSFLGNQGCGGREFRVKQTPYGGDEAVSTKTGDWELHCNDQSFRNLDKFVAGPLAFQNIHEILPLISATVTKLDLSENSVGDLNQTLFERFRRLNELRLKNTQLRSFDVEAISTSNHNYLNRLDISNNHLNEIKNSRMLYYFKNLIELDAGGNEIQNASEIIASLPDRLQRLNMAHSNVGEINQRTFEKLRDLTHLDLSDTHLSFADFNVFLPLVRLINLNIADNDLSQVNVTSLAQLYQLQEFRAANCHIANVSAVIQSLGPYVEKLDLSKNSAAEIDPNSFDRFNRLKKISLSGMGLQRLNPSIFEHLSSLTDLDLSGNKLIELSNGLPKNLQKLNLHGNNLQKIENLNATHFPFLRELKISQNQLECDYVDELRAQFNDKIVLVDDPKFNAFEQKNDTCHSNLMFILLCIFAAFLILLILICVCFLCRKRLCRKDY